MIWRAVREAAARRGAALRAAAPRHTLLTPQKSALHAAPLRGTACCSTSTPQIALSLSGLRLNSAQRLACSSSACTYRPYLALSLSCNCLCTAAGRVCYSSFVALGMQAGQWHSGAALAASAIGPLPPPPPPPLLVCHLQPPPPQAPRCRLGQTPASAGAVGAPAGAPSARAPSRCRLQHRHGHRGGGRGGAGQGVSTGRRPGTAAAAAPAVVVKPSPSCTPHSNPPPPHSNAVGNAAGRTWRRRLDAPHPQQHRVALLRVLQNQVQVLVKRHQRACGGARGIPALLSCS